MSADMGIKFQKLHRSGNCFIMPNAWDAGSAVLLAQEMLEQGSFEFANGQMPDAELCRSFAINGKPASSVLSITVQKAYYQCQKALVRSRLWDPESHVDRAKLPSAGQMAQHFSARQGQDFDGKAYDQGLGEYIKENMY
jgi:hypothetical protein